MKPNVEVLTMSNAPIYVWIECKAVAVVEPAVIVWHHILHGNEQKYQDSLAQRTFDFPFDLFLSKIQRQLSDIF